MNTLLEFVPIIAFFAVFRWVGGPEAVYPATVAGIAGAVLVTAFHWFRHRTVPGRQLLMLGVFIVMGGFTLAFHDPRFIQAKPTIVSWVTAVAFLGSQFVGEKTLLERMMGGAMVVPRPIWKRFNLVWVLFFSALGGINLYVAAHYSMDVWVDFKVFGIMGITLVFAIVQGFFLVRYDESPDSTANDP